MIDENVNKKGEIILCKGIKLDKNYENVLSYNESDMVSLCDSNKIYRGSNYSFMETGKTLNVEVPYKDAMFCNYIAFKNHRFGDKWIFGFVNSVELISPKVTAISWEIDVWSTWYSSFNVGKAFIEREHVDDDTIGKHTIPEGLELGDLVVSNKVEVLNDNTNFKICIALTEINENITIPSAGANINKVYNGVYSGVYYIACNSPNDATNLIKIYDKLSRADAIASVFMIPTSFCELETYSWSYDGVSATVRYISFDTESLWVGTGIIDRPDAIDTYTPVNGKLFTYPYCYCNVTNNSGITIPFRYEDSTNINDLTNKTCLTFFLEGAVTPGLSIKAIPRNYKGLIDAYNYGIPLGKFPVCSWTSDVYINWLTQNGVNSVLGGVSSALGVVSGVATGNPLVGVGGVLGILNSMHQIDVAKMTPDQARGNINSGDINFSYTGSGGLSLYNMTIKKEYAISIDSYFSRFGYKVNEVKQPNLNSRSQFNFIKVGGSDELVHGDIPASDLEKINNICRKGVTIFHNYTNFGNYTISNPIVE